MKKLWLLTLTLLISVMVFSQKLDADKVPQVVKDSLLKSHPAVTPVWEWEDGNYEANFQEGGKTLSCIIDKRGAILQTETEITFEELPDAARNYVISHANDKKVKETTKVVYANGEIKYEVVREGAELIFDFEGKFLRSKKERKEKD